MFAVHRKPKEHKHDVLYDRAIVESLLKENFVLVDRFFVQWRDLRNL